MEVHKVKILVIRFSSIGDIVLTTPVVRCLKEQLEGDVSIHYLTKKQFGSIVQHNPNIEKVYSITKSTDEIIGELKNERYDYIIDLHKNLRSKRVIKKLKVLSFTFDKLNYQKWLFTSFKINKLPDIHIVDRYFEAVKILNVENDQKGLDFFIPNHDKVAITELPLTHQNGYIAIAIGAQHVTKRLPTDKIISICQQINGPIVLLGGKSDRETGSQIVSETSNLVLNTCGNYSLNQSASLVKQSQQLITHDTGLMHIGAALRVQIISVWGNTVPDFGMYPYYPRNPEKFVVIENNNLRCRPCSKIGFDKCPKKHFKCMNDIDEKEIVQHLK